MAGGRKCKRQHKDNKNKDIISDLSDSILIHILSFLTSKEAVQTCVLSKRWIILWKSVPTLTLISSHFRTRIKIDDFVSQFLSLRDGSTAIHTLNLYGRRRRECSLSLLQRIIKDAVSHNVQHLLIDYTCNMEHFPSCFFKCHTLTTLNLSGYKYDTYFRQKPIFPNSLNLPVLTSLSLKYFAFAPSDDGCVTVDPFSAFKMLNTLIIDCCIVLNAQNLCISSAKLVNLTILLWIYFPEDYLGISFGIELYAPSLHTFAFTGRFTPKLFGSKTDLSSIKHVSIDLSCECTSRSRSSVLLNWLIELANIESLTFHSRILQDISLVPDLLKVELHSLCHLKSLKIKAPQNAPIPSKVVAFLIQNSPSANVDIIHL